MTGMKRAKTNTDQSTLSPRTSAAIRTGRTGRRRPSVPGPRPRTTSETTAMASSTSVGMLRSNKTTMAATATSTAAIARHRPDLGLVARSLLVSGCSMLLGTIDRVKAFIVAFLPLVGTG
jgi:hypothetical protein